MAFFATPKGRILVFGRLKGLSCLRFLPFRCIVGLGLELLVHMFVIFVLLALLPRVVVLAYFGWSRLAARILLVHHVPNLSAIRMRS